MRLSKYLIYILTAVTLTACKKQAVPAPVADEPPASPKMNYFDLSGKSISLTQGKSLSIDLNSDQRGDVYFYFQLVASGVDNWVKYQLIGGSTLSVELPYGINTAGEDFLKDLHKGETFPSGDWYNGSEAVIIQKVENTKTNQIHWEGNWSGKGHLYLPLKLLENGAVRNGWIELEADIMQQKIILYNAALCREPGRTITAGV